MCSLSPSSGHLRSGAPVCHDLALRRSTGSCGCCFPPPEPPRRVDTWLDGRATQSCDPAAHLAELHDQNRSLVERADGGRRHAQVLAGHPADPARLPRPRGQPQAFGAADWPPSSTSPLARSRFDAVT